MRATIFSSSFFLRHLLLFWCWLQEAYLASRFHRVVSRLCVALANGGRESRVFAALRRDGTLTRAYPDSRFYRLVCKVLDAPGALFDWLWRKRAVRQSFFVRLLRILGRRTWAMLALLFALMLVVPHAQWNNLYGFLGIVLITLLFFLAAAGRRGTGRRLDGEGFSFYFAVYALLLLLGLVCSMHFGLSLRFFLFHLTCLLTVLLLSSAVSTRRQLKCLLGILLVGLTLCALYGCYQRMVGVEVVASQVDYTLELNQGIPGRVYSFFDNPNNFAEILVMLMPLYLAFFCLVKGWRKGIVLLCMVPALWAMMQTYSRSGWIGLALAALVFLAFQNWRLIPACALAVLVALPFLPQTVLNRILSIGNSNDSSTLYRFQIYDTLWPMFRDFWASGVGLGSDTVKEVIQTYPTKLLNGAYPIHSHNTYLQLWLEAGILAPIAYLGGTFYQIKQGVRGMKHCSKELKYIISAAIGGLVGVMVIALAEYTWFYPRVMFLFWLLLGILMVAAKLASGEGEAAQEAEAAQSRTPTSFEQAEAGRAETARHRARRLVLRPAPGPGEGSGPGGAEDGLAPGPEAGVREAVDPLAGASWAEELPAEEPPEASPVDAPPEEDHAPLAGLTLAEKEAVLKQFYDVPGPDQLKTPLWELELELGLTEEGGPFEETGE